MSAAGAGARNSSFVLLAVAMLAIGLDVGVARITYGVAPPALARDLQLSLTAAGLLGTLHLIGYLLGTLTSPSLNAKVGACALPRRPFRLRLRNARLRADVRRYDDGGRPLRRRGRCGLRCVLHLSHRLRRNQTGKAFRGGIAGLSGIGVAIVASGLASSLILDGSGWRLSFIVPAGLALAVAMFMPRTTSSVHAKPKAADASTSRLAELTSAMWIFLLAAYFLFAAGYISYATFAGVILKGIGLSSAGVLLSGGFARRIALSAALGSGAIGSLLVVHGGNWSVFAASILVGLGSVATPAIFTFLIRSRTSDEAYPFFFTIGTASLGLGQLSGPAVCGLFADWFGLSAIGWLAAATYGSGMLAAAADGNFGQRQRVTTANRKEDRYALPAS